MSTMTLEPQSRFLRAVADEIRKEGHAGWGNTCEQAADAIDAHLRDREAAVEWKYLGTLQIDSFATGQKLVRSCIVGQKVMVNVTDGDSRWTTEIDVPWAKKVKREESKP